MVMRSVKLIRVAAFAWRPLFEAAKIRQVQLPHYKNTALIKSFLKFPLSVLIPVMAAVGTSTPELQKVIDESETLYEKKDFPAMYDLLSPHKDTTDSNVLWRLARAATEKGKMGDAEQRKSLIYEAWGYITRALELDTNNFAVHKWYGILLDYTGEYEGTKQRIANAFKVKEHFMKALEINPKDATTMYCLGYWCYLFADMPWYQRKVASVIFASPPTSTYEEAQDYFLKAEQAEPGFYNNNNLMLGRVYLKLKDKAEAKKYFEKARDYYVKTEDDKKAVTEAIDHLKSL